MELGLQLGVPTWSKGYNWGCLYGARATIGGTYMELGLQLGGYLHGARAALGWYLYGARATLGGTYMELGLQLGVPLWS